MVQREEREREKEIPVTERLCRVGLHREERRRSGRDEQQLSDILFVPPRPPVCITIHSLCESRLDLTALQLCMDMCVFLCVCVLTWVFRSTHTKQMGGGDGNEESQTETRQRDSSVGSESLCFVDEAGRHPEVLGGRVRLIPHAWLEV